MKVIILTTDLVSNNGWGKYSIDVMRALCKEGIEVEVVTPMSANNESNISVHALLPPHTNYFKIYVMSPYYAWRIKMAISDADIIHCFAEPYSVIAYWLAKFTGKKYILTTHGTYGVLPYGFSLLKRYLHNLSFKSASVNICVSNYTKEILSKYNINNTVVINNGIDTSSHDQNTVVALENRENIILTVGALKQRKGHHVSIRAFAEFTKSNPGFRYCIVGDKSDADYLNKLKSIVQECGIEDKVNFLGTIPDIELKKLYEKSKLFILTSVSKKLYFEGFGLVYLEANMFGLPVIGSRNSGAVDAICDGNTGFLVEQENVLEIAKCMDLILGDIDLWNKMSSYAKEYVRDRSWEKIIGGYVRIYKMVTL